MCLEYAEFRGAPQALFDHMTDSENPKTLNPAASQALFDHMTESAPGGVAAAAAAALAELHVEGFDAEQIWGQLDMQVRFRV